MNISQTSVIFGIGAVAFILFITLRGELAEYIGILTA